MTFLWPDEGASHSQTMMKMELQFLSTEFTQSLLLPNPAQTVSTWLFVATLEAWKKYNVLVNRVEPEKPEWPEKPRV
ncbi:hypothetical protein TCT1_17470 [Xenorhabdus sp. TCT-1]|uniref:Tail fiber assembly protein n=1 Tax=Xenorhabdus taiwanensis TaxID=3085177 RepID=A0ABM8JVU4_9GAMM|nr:hypothetical protein TCT1_17470 [Xenorhabdus sp. TCT-1]